MDCQNFPKKVFDSFSEIYEEIDESGGEFDFRYSLAKSFLEGVLGWKRKKGEGHFKVEEERKDILAFDDSNPPFPVLIIETKKPSTSLGINEKEQLDSYFRDVGSAKYGVLTNGKRFILFNYDSSKDESNKELEIDLKQIKNSEFEELSEDYKSKLNKLRYLSRNRFIGFEDSEYFRNNVREIDVEYKSGESRGYELFLNSLKLSIGNLTELMEEFFVFYSEIEEYIGDFFDSSYSEWEDWRQFTGSESNPKETFCRETAYIMINRVLFARILEDKKIATTSKLSGERIAHKIEIENEPYLDSFKDSKDVIEKHYPHLSELGIFDWWWVPETQKSRMSYEIKNEINSLYNKLDYELGQLLKKLNRFNFETVNRDILGHVYEDYLPPQKRKELGEFYTPVEIVKYILDSVGYVENKNNLGQKKILDPACGSGTFLVESTDRLINHYLNKFQKGEEKFLQPDEAKKILEKVGENIVGLDINFFATNIAELNLLFRTIDLYEITKKKYKNYQIPRFNIHCTDSLKASRKLREAKKTQSTFEEFAKYNGRAKAFIQDTKEAEKIKENRKFDYVVANPPYVKMQNLSDMKEHYSKIYDTTYKNYDIYVPFIEKGIKWLKDKGDLGYITPNRFLLSEYGEKLRDFLLDYKIYQIIDFKETEVFDASTPYPCILTLKKTKKSSNKIKCARISKKDERITTKLKNYSGSPYHREKTFDVFEYEQSDLDSGFWTLMPEKELEVFNKITNKSQIKVKNFLKNNFVGLQTSADKIYLGRIISEKNELAEFKPKGEKSKSFYIEKKLLKKVLKGKDIDRWIPEWNGLWLIFPYRLEETKMEVIPEEKMEEEYPKALEYFKNYEFKLRNRAGLKKGETFYKYPYRKNLEMFEGKKVLVEVLAQKPSFAADLNGEFYFVGGGNAGGYGMNPKEKHLKHPDSLSFYIGLFNSKIIEFYHKHNSVIFNDKYYSFRKSYTNKIPLIKEENTKKNSEIKTISNEIVSSLNEKNKLKIKVNDFYNNYRTNKMAKNELIDLAIDVSLSDDEYRHQPMRYNKEMKADSQIIHQLVLKRGHKISFGNEVIPKYLLKLLKSRGKRISRSNLLSLKIPSEGKIKEIMEEYRSDKQRIGQLEDKAEKLEEELNEIISKEIYDLSDSDLEVINSFLEVW
ncbi:N-6 DNA methylase [Methanonatronarchaeum sp. AMET-Sl]|uniref:Eco57I restriction-modification methylase domain-containing protein n=1 Tax=Methanonatronarchaeum sp. AMET-Sl TaxID=3037654 RepID=UPI00244E5698|nr:N-6 DNA methylase [Methanonatronarchaeum sp. AMET-Sl]WGI17955.1 N-6 DNA methylase [Methanonatronarchaeum sp. AMET-Sl]